MSIFRLKRCRSIALVLLLVLSAASQSWAKEIRVVGLFPDKAVVMIDGQQALLIKGMPGPGGVLLHSASSNAVVLEVDGKTRSHQMSISRAYQPSPSKPAVSNMVTIRPDSSGMYNILGSIDGKPVNFLVDTGASMVVMNDAEAKRLGVDYRTNGTETIAETASGIVKTFVVNLKKVRVGGVEVDNVKGGVIEGQYPTEVLLGNSFLNEVSLNQERSIMMLRTR